MPLVITYHPTLPSISKLARNHWNVMIENSPRLEKIFSLPPVWAYKRSKNLRDILVKAKLPSGKRSIREKEGFKKCGRLCVVCSLTENASSHTDKRTGQSWKIYSELNCQSSDVIYKLGFRKCSDFTYIGQTGNKFVTRVIQHKGCHQEGPFTAHWCSLQQ